MRIEHAKRRIPRRNKNEKTHTKTSDRSITIL